MYFKKGTYQHEANTVTLASFNYRPVRTPRGRRMTTRVEMHIVGELLADPTLSTDLQRQDDLNTKIAAMNTAYEADYEDVGFYRDDNDVTAHFIQSSNATSLTGNVLLYLNWAPGDDTEFCAKRSFQAGFYNEFVDAYSNVIDYVDSVKRIGRAGPIYQWRNYPTIPAQPRMTNLYSTQLIVHVGKATALIGHPTPPVPLASGANFLQHLSEVTYISPKRWGQGYAVYQTMWKYVYAFPFNNPLAPVTP